MDAFFVCVSNLLILTSGLNLDVNYPLIYEDPKYDSLRPTYFGYSVLVYGQDEYHWIQIGAPRSNDSISPNILEPGLVYRCKLGGFCSTYTFEQPGSTSNDRFLGKKNGGWLGGTMAIQKDSGIVAVCASRWTNLVGMDLKMQGLCYTTPALPDDENIDVLIPLENYATYSLGSGKAIHFNNLGQVGVSACFSGDQGIEGIQLLLGAPGVLNWRGSAVLYTEMESPGKLSKRSTTGLGMMGRAIELKTIKVDGIRDADITGYSVAMGRFYPSQERLYVSGAPKSNNYKGRVIIYKFPNENLQQPKIIQSLTIEKFGGYFGSTIEAGRLNNDNLDDLLVSAPHLPTPTVYIYLGNMKQKSLVVPTIGLQRLQGGSLFGRNSHFGTSLAISDLDLDGNNEVLVGAPYADDGHGAIAIWAGSPTGPKGTGPPTSVLQATKFYGNLRGFGISIASPMDLDNNSYPEVAIGAYISGHVVVFRGRPVIQLAAQLGNNKTISLYEESKTLTVPMCLEYRTSRNNATIINVRREISIDSVFKRGYRSGGSPMEDIFIDTLTFQHYGVYCESLNITMKNSTSKNSLNQFVILLKVSLLDYTTEHNVIIIKSNSSYGTDKFNKLYPIAIEANAKIEIPFTKNCGPDNICKSDLITNIATKKNITHFVLGSAESLLLDITVHNKEEPAYLTQLKIFLSESTTLTYIPATCNNLISYILCNMENPLEQNASKTLTIEINMQEKILNSKDNNKLSIIAEAITKSEEINRNDNINTFNLPLLIEANIVVNGKSLQDLHTYTTSEDGISEELVGFKQLYEVYKTGVSPIEEALITIRVPYEFSLNSKTFSFVQINQPEGFQNGQQFSCVTNTNFSYSYYDERSSTEFKMSETEIERTKRDVVLEKTINISEKLPANRTIDISCGRTKIHCHEIICNIGPFKKSYSSARLVLTMALNMSAVKSLMGKKDILVVKSEGSANIEDSWNPSKTPSHITVESIFISSPHVGKVALWLIVMSAILGLLFLTLVIFGLIKAGFFKRTKKEELDALRSNEETNDPLNDMPDYDINASIEDMAISLEDKASFQQENSY